MNCTIPAQNTKVLCKAINSLAKVGDEIYLEAYKDKLKFVTFNMSKTVCAQCDFFESFFSSFGVAFDGDEEKLTCKLFMKSILPLLKGNLDKKLEFLKIEFNANSDFIVFKMKYKFDQVSMIHKLRLMEPENLSIGIEANSGKNNLCSNSSFFNEFLSMFNLSDSEITLDISHSKVIARNYYPGAPSNPNLMRCEIKLGAGEFLVYGVQDETSINFALKPLKTVISFAECFNLHIGLNFDSGGKPLTILMKNPTFEINFLISTLNPHKDIQSTMSTSSFLTISQRNRKNLNITIEDQQALETENWDDVMMFADSEKQKEENVNKSQSIIIDEVASSSKTVNEESVVEDNFDNNSIDPLEEMQRRKKLRLVFSRCYEPTKNLRPKNNESFMYDTVSQ